MPTRLNSRSLINVLPNLQPPSEVFRLGDIFNEATRGHYQSGATCRFFPTRTSAAPAVIILAQEAMYRDAALDSRSRIGPTGHTWPDPGPTQKPGTLGGYLGHGTNARPPGPGEAPRHAAPATTAQTIGARGLNNQTVRMIVRTSVAGRRLRVRLSNAFGGTPVVLGAAHLAIRAKESAIVPDSDRPLTFK